MFISFEVCGVTVYNSISIHRVKGWMGTFVRKTFPWVCVSLSLYILSFISNSDALPQLQIVGRDFCGKIIQIGSKVNDQKLKEKGIDIGSFVCGMIDHFRNDG